MATKYWTLPGGTIKEGVPYYGDNDTTDYALFEDKRIIIYRLGKDKGDFGVLITEGKFSYPNGEAAASHGRADSKFGTGELAWAASMS